ncbi:MULTISPECIES: hypothetical protein [Paenibacillus]|uniref:hypothetical protein n=1 Tax=Paenibacillus TaxID=44249 RepID=UPI0011EB62C3|nr:MULTISPECIES: hypothetical protein [Paenibacillus]URJ58877.3 hypothetical protein MF622_003466 [Paenibacillus polymyxa]
MRFQIGDETDRHLVSVIVHEFSRCELAFDQFIKLRGIKHKGDLVFDNKIDLMTYNAYSLFIQHLYEYFKGCVTRSRENTGNISFEVIDSLMNREVNKILKNWRDAIDNNYAPKWANDRSYYEDVCPENFGRDFRNIRNNVAHVDFRRINGGSRITLTQFYKDYHKYAILLFYNGRDYWSISDYGDLDFGDITSFNKLT